MNTHSTNIMSKTPFRAVLIALTAASLWSYRAAAQGETDPPPPAVIDEASEIAEVDSLQHAAIIPITDEITDVTTESIKRRVEQARKNGARTIIFEINTPGGYVTSALDICNYIKNLDGVKTIAWINTDAYSAGSMISVACDEIVMARASTLGDCGVIMGGPTGAEAVPEELRAKAESPVLEQFRDSARRNGYNVLLCESMVVKERVVYWVENIETGERRFVDEEEKDDLIAETPKPTKIFGFEITPPSGDDPEWKLVETYPDPLTGKDFDIEQPVVSSSELLTLSQSRAGAFGFSQAIVADEDDLRERYNLVGDIERIDFTWSEVFTRWLTSMPVRGFLLVIVLLGAYVEFNTPGLGVAGAVAVIALSIFLGAPFLTGLANVWELVLIILGFALIAVEMFVIPGFGVAGISGIILVFVGLLATFMPDEPGQFPIYWPELAPSLDGLETGIQTIASAVGLSIVGMVLLGKYLPQLPYLNRIIPANPTAAEVRVDEAFHGAAHVGDVGRVISLLRPVGKARFGATMVDVVSEGEVLEEGIEVEVIERHGNRVVVRALRGKA